MDFKYILINYYFFLEAYKECSLYDFKTKRKAKGSVLLPKDATFFNLD